MPWGSVTEALLSFLKKGESNRIRKERPERTDVDQMHKTFNVTKLFFTVSGVYDKMNSGGVFRPLRLNLQGMFF